MSVSTDTQRRWFTHRVQSLMGTILDEAVEPDRDGDFAVHGQTSLLWVRPVARGPWWVQVFATAALGVPRRAAVLQEINAINAHDPAVRVAWHTGGRVLVDFLLFADAATEDNLHAAIERVLGVADQIGPTLTAVHGGTTPKVATPSASEH